MSKAAKIGDLEVNDSPPNNDGTNRLKLKRYLSTRLVGERQSSNRNKEQTSDEMALKSQGTQVRPTEQPGDEPQQAARVESSAEFAKRLRDKLISPRQNNEQQPHDVSRSNLIKQEPDDEPIDGDDVREDESDDDIASQGWYRPERLVEPPPLNDDLRRENQRVFDDLRDSVATNYESPEQILQMAINLNANQQRDPRFNALKPNEAFSKRQRRNIVWGYEQEQLIVAFAMRAIKEGKDLSKIDIYKTMLKNPMLSYVQDPVRIRSHLLTMCHEDNVRQLQDYCGFNIATDDQQRQAVRNVANSIRVGCLDWAEVDRWNLRAFARQSTYVPKRRPCFDGPLQICQQGQQFKRSRGNIHRAANFAAAESTTTVTKTTIMTTTRRLVKSQREIRDQSSKDRNVESAGPSGIDTIDLCESD